jgi:hypothetical protein
MNAIYPIAPGDFIGPPTTYPIAPGDFIGLPTTYPTAPGDLLQGHSAAQTMRSRFTFTQMRAASTCTSVT